MLDLEHGGATEALVLTWLFSSSRCGLRWSQWLNYNTELG